MSVIAGLTATKAAVDITKIVMDKLNTASVDVHAVRASVQELLIHVVNAQVSLGEANVEISELRIAGDLQYQNDGGFYVRQSDGAPCCPVCWGDNQKAVPMTPTANGHYMCAIHRSSYQTAANKERNQRIDEANRNQRRRLSGSTAWG
jgi:hypothetical protein